MFIEFDNGTFINILQIIRMDKTIAKNQNTITVNVGQVFPINDEQYEKIAEVLKTVISRFEDGLDD